MNPTLLLFDLDGVLVDAADWHYEALNKALVELGEEPISYEDHMENFNGLPTKKKLQKLGHKGKFAKEISKAKQSYTYEIIKERCRPDADKVALLWELHKWYRVGVCTNATRKSALMMLGLSGLLPYIHFVLSNEDIKKPKPHPEIYLKAMTMAGFVAEDTCIFEDSPVGLKAAKKSKARVAEVTFDSVTLERLRIP
jgi:HAD superfamily hydrolase (TIGR01509 family)